MSLNRFQTPDCKMSLSILKNDTRLQNDTRFPNDTRLKNDTKLQNDNRSHNDNRMSLSRLKNDIENCIMTVDCRMRTYSRMTTDS
jgi:hypothetical protein